MKQLLLILFLATNICVAQTKIQDGKDQILFYTDSIIWGDVNLPINQVEVDLIDWYPSVRVYSDTCSLVINHRHITIFSKYRTPRIISYPSTWLFDPWVNAIQYQDCQAPYDYHTYYLPASRKVRIIER